MPYEGFNKKENQPFSLQLIVTNNNTKAFQKFPFY